ncbi:MAG: ThuA domain-containing protein [Opitutaceae bacterium]
MKKILFVLLFAASTSLFAAADALKPIKALMITGGGFHDYELQKKTLSDGISARMNIEWTILHEGTTREHKHSAYANPDWAKGYDVIVHNECFGTVAEPDFVARVAAPHKAGIPAVILHATVHSYRFVEGDAWREILGIKSMSHEAARDFLVKSLKTNHPVMRGFPDEWADSKDELYKVEKTWESVTPLAKAFGTETQKDHVVIWLNTVGKTRVFATTLGHSDATMKTDVYLDLVTRGILWSVGKLGDDGKPLPGYERQGK